jgi:hypothetical protein
MVQFLSARPDERILAPNENNTIGINVLLELWLHQFSHRIFIDLVFYCWNFLALFVDGWGFFLWRFWLNDENLLGSYIAERIAI